MKECGYLAHHGQAGDELGEVQSAIAVAVQDIEQPIGKGSVLQMIQARLGGETESVCVSERVCKCKKHLFQKDQGLLKVCAVNHSIRRHLRKCVI